MARFRLLTESPSSGGQPVTTEALRSGYGMHEASHPHIQ
jgi:hypothetical protein